MIVRTDISHAVDKLTKFLKDLTNAKMKTLQSMLIYFNPACQLVIFSDSDWNVKTLPNLPYISLPRATKKVMK
jgi:hypothetical protein